MNKQSQIVSAASLPSTPAESPLPSRLLYATSARIGGSGLDSVAHQSLIASSRASFLSRAIAYDTRQQDVPRSEIRSLRWHPVRLLSALDRAYYYPAKKKYVDWVASRALAHGNYDCFHGWSGDSLRTLREARRRDIPTLLEIPTWHRNKGRQKPEFTKSERELYTAQFPKNYLNRLLVTRQHILEEYDLADLILILSEKAKETFLAAGFAERRLFKLERGVDVHRFHPAPPPPIFRAIFVGALIERKGVHLLLEAWHRLNLANAELLLVGTVHDEIKPWLAKYAGPTVKTLGFVPKVEQCYQQSSLQIFPSLCEGSAKALYEAAACGLAQISTPEAGDVVLDGVNGLLVPAENVDALAEAIQTLYDNPHRLAEMGAAGRQRMEEKYTWDHFRERLLQAYRLVMSLPR